MPTRAVTHDPITFGWRWVRDESGSLIARCRKCAPASRGKAADTIFGTTFSRRGGSARREED